MRPRICIALWAKEWRALSRDRHGLAAIFLMPAVFILVMSLALRDTLRPAGKGPLLRYAVLDLDRTPASRELAALLAGPGFQEDLAGSPEASLKAALGTGRLPFALRIPAGFEADLADPDAPERLTLLEDPAADGQARLTFRQHTLVALGVLKTRALVRQLPPPLGTDLAQGLTLDRLQDALAEEAVRRGAPAALPNAVQQNVPAWLIFGMFFVVIPISAIFVQERRQGTLQRLRSMGLGHGDILAGKLIPFMGVNLVQTLLMLAVGFWVVPRLGGDALTLPRGAWPPFLGMALAISLAAVSWALLVASAFRTTEQATIVGGVGNILMAALGGIMVPRFVMPAGMQALTRISPMAWGLDGFHAVLLRGQGWGGLLPSAARLLAFALVALALAAALAARRNRCP